MRRWFVVHRRGMPLMPLHERLRDFFSSEGPGIIAERERSYSSLAEMSASSIDDDVAPTSMPAAGVFAASA